MCIHLSLSIYIYIYIHIHIYIIYIYIYIYIYKVKSAIFHRPPKGDPKRGISQNKYHNITFKSTDSDISSESPFLDPSLG